jgi:hypothetical protein
MKEFKREFVALPSNLTRRSEDRVDRSFKQAAPRAGVSLRG